MNDKKTLPIAKSLFTTFHYEGAAGACLLPNPTVNNWFLNNSIDIRSNTSFFHGYTSPNIYLCNTNFHDCPHIDIKFLSLEYLWDSLPKIVKNMIDDDYYVFVYNVDDYYVEGKSNYKTMHFPHDFLITGYDNEKHTYDIYAYDENWVYRVFSTSQKGVRRGMKYCLDKGDIGQILALKVKDDDVKLDFDTMLTSLKRYLDSDFEKYPFEGDFKEVFGIITHNYAAMYLDKLYDGSIPYERMDRRVFKAFYDHKSVMLERIKLIEKEYSLSDNLSSKYAKIVRAADMMRMIYAHYNKRHDNELLISINSMLLDVKQKEYEILTELIRQTEKNNIKEAV